MKVWLETFQSIIDRPLSLKTSILSHYLGFPTETLFPNNHPSTHHILTLNGLEIPLLYQKTEYPKSQPPTFVVTLCSTRHHIEWEKSRQNTSLHKSPTISLFRDSPIISPRFTTSQLCCPNLQLKQSLQLYQISSRLGKVQIGFLLTMLSY